MQDEITTQNEIGQIDRELREYEFLTELEANWHKSLPRFSETQWLDIFPEAREILPEKVREWETEKQRLIGIVKKYLRERTHENYWYVWVAVQVAVIPRIEDAANHIARLQRQIRHVSARRSIIGHITETDIQRARDIPIASLIPSNIRRSGKTFTTNCPLHEDRSPSFVIYTETNSCWCFGCQQGGDCIALTRLLHGLSFIEAVKYLLRV